MKGIILAGGTGSRLYPATKPIVKQLLPVYDKPMIYYPMSILMLAGIREILIISTPKDLPAFESLFGDGSKMGLDIKYKEQPAPNGIAQAFLLGEEFIGDDSVCLILGDNLLHAQNLSETFKTITEKHEGAAIFGYPVTNPSEFGVCEFDSKGNVISIEEKPSNPKSKYAVPGLYFYDNDVVAISKALKPSARGELEITDVNNEYIKKGKCKVHLFGRGVAWFDTGTAKSLLNASSFVEMIETRQGYYIACLEEIAWRKGFIDKNQLRELGNELKNSEYGQYLLDLAEEKL